MSRQEQVEAMPLCVRARCVVFRRRCRWNNVRFMGVAAAAVDGIQPAKQIIDDMLSTACALLARGNSAVSRL